MILLAIDTSCDETSVAVLEDDRVLASVLATQFDLHRQYGGIMPSVSRRAHEENIHGTYLEALKRARKDEKDLDYIAVTQGPGLAIDLEVGIRYAQDLAKRLRRPLIPVNHMEGHLLSGLLRNRAGKLFSKGVGVDIGKLTTTALDRIFPALGVLVSGKHTEIVYIGGLGGYTKLAYTLDDAAGEAFDKVGRMLGFGYPGGPVISEFAKSGHLGVVELPIPMYRSKELRFSFSGLKTACLYALKKHDAEDTAGDKRQYVADFARQFEFSVVSAISEKVIRVLDALHGTKSELNNSLDFEKDVQSVRDAISTGCASGSDAVSPPRAIFAGGGVINNVRLSGALSRIAKRYKTPFFLPYPRFRSDNAAMIGLAAYLHILYDGEEYALTNAEDIEKVERIPRLSVAG